jgi:hypothetical protein
LLLFENGPRSIDGGKKQPPMMERVHEGATLVTQMAADQATSFDESDYFRLVASGPEAMQN